MTPFEDIINELGSEMGINLKPDSHESCKLEFVEGVSIQIDLAGNADQVLIGCELGKLAPGTYRERIFKQALCVNGLSKEPRGVLAFSEKKSALIFFQFLPLSSLNGEKLFHFTQLFLENAKVWIEALKSGNVPALPEAERRPSGHFGLH